MCAYNAQVRHLHIIKKGDIVNLVLLKLQFGINKLKSAILALDRRNGIMPQGLASSHKNDKYQSTTIYSPILFF